jgi:hypothetical protein
MANKYKADFTKPPQMDARWNGGESLGTKIETMFTRFIQRLIHWGYEFFAELLVDIFDQSMKIMRPGMAKAVDPAIQEFLKDPTLPPHIKSMLQTALTETGESSWIIKLAILYTSIIGTLTGGLAPIRRLAEYNADKTARSYLPSPQELATLSHLGLVSPQAYDDNMAKLGIAEPLKPVYLEYVRNLPSLGELFNGLWRGVYSEGDFTNALKRMGYNDKDSKLFLELSKQIPPLQDLIRMLVRDAFNDSASSKYGYDEDYPTEINQYFAKQGYNPDWAKRYWRAHWNLPSPNQVYEMLHRGLIDTGTMEELLRISDYPKFWRDKLVGISYNVYTRVDLRRLLQSGIIDEAQALKGYKEMGYDEEKAQALVKFARIGVSEKEKDLTRTDIINLYEDNILDRGQVQDALVKMGYDSQEAEYLLDRADFNIAKSLRVDMINYTHERFIAKLIDKTGVITELTTTGLTQNQIDRYLLQWTRSTETNVTNVSKADALKFFGGGYIDEGQLRSYLSNLGYSQNDVDLYVRQANDSKSQTGERQA